LLDTVLVKYTIVNTGNSDCTVALRTMLDTYIGGSDGVPFNIPAVEGRPEHTVDTMEVLTDKQIPQYVQVLETGDLNDPKSTNAVIGLKLNGCEEPVKFVICRYPGESGGGGQAAWGGGEASKGDWPYRAMNDPPDAKKDSCAVIYWSKSNLQPKARRVMGYSYGLGKIYDASDVDTTIAKAGNKQLGLSVVKATTKAPFGVTAFVTGDKSQKVTLKLPAGVEFASGETPEKTLDATVQRAAVTWMVKSSATGVKKFEAEAPGIGKASLNVDVRAAGTGLFD
jgi:hypothetical protein